MKARKALVCIAGVLFLLAMVPFVSHSEVPQQINYQGYLTDSGGSPLNATPTMDFDIYDAATGGTFMWGESQTVNVVNGNYSIEIGQDPVNNPFPVNLFEGSRYLELTVNGEPLSPRLHLTCSPFAMKAADADSLEGQRASEFALEGHVHSWGEITGIPSGFADGVDNTGITSETDPTVLASVKNGVSWGEIQAMPAGFADGVDNTGITSETDPQVGNITSGYVPVWNGSELVSSSIYDVGHRVGIGTNDPSQKFEVDNGDILVQGAGSFDEAGEEAFLFLGDTNSYIKAVHGSGVRIGSWFTGDALAIQQVTGNVGIGTVNPTYGKLHVNSNNGGNAIYGVSNMNWGALGTTDAGAEGHHDYGHYGKLGTSTAGAIGTNANGNYGLLGWSGYGVFGYNSSSTNQGMLAGYTEGALGKHISSGNFGQLGRSDYGAYGKHVSSGNWGALGTEAVGVEGRTTSTNEWHNAIYGRNEGAGSGVYGWSQNHYGTVGVSASTDSNDAGVWAVNNGVGPGIIATAGSDGYAAIMKGNLLIRSAMDGSDIVELGEGLDYAEGFHVTEKRDISPGSVLVIDSVNPGKLMLSQDPYDTKVAGIVAGAKGLGSGIKLGSGRFDHDVALAGRVYCNVDANYGEVEPGDLLTTAPKAGYAMRVADYSRAQGAILGKAMQGLKKGEKGQILVLVTLQ